MTAMLAAELTKAADELRMPAGDVFAVTSRGDRRGRRRRMATSLISLALLVVAAGGGVNLARGDDRPPTPGALSAPQPRTISRTPTSAPTPEPMPPPRPVPPVLADPSPTQNEFPISIETYNEGVGARLRHRSGGPYLSEADVRQRALNLAGCASKAGDPVRCDGAVVRFFESYAAAYKEYGPPAWQYMGGFGHDREVYLVTVYGALPLCPKTISRYGSDCPLYLDHTNLVIDATTGEPS